MLRCKETATRLPNASGIDAELRKVSCPVCNQTLIKENVKPGSCFEVRCLRCRSFVGIKKHEEGSPLIETFKHRK